MRLWQLAGAVALALMPGVAGAAPPTDDAAAEFGAREAIRQISLSPDGSHAAVVAPYQDRGEALFIADLVKGGQPRLVLTASGKPDRLTHCRWSSDTRLVCSIFIQADSGSGLISFTRLVGINRDGGGMKMLSNRQLGRVLGYTQQGGDVTDWTGDGHSGTALITRNYVPEETIGTHLAETREGLGVDLIDTATLVRHTVEQPRRGVVDYISDGHGTVRLMAVQATNNSGYETGRIIWMYRKPDERDWRKLGEVRDTGGVPRGFSPVAVDRDANVAYGFDQQDGRSALFRMSLDGSLKKELVASRPDVDIDDLIRIGRQRRVVGTSWVTNKRDAQFFDPELERLRGALGKALPGRPLLTFVDASADEKRLLLFVGSDNDPGRYYVFDKGTHHLEEVLPARPELTGVALATVKPITYKAADGTTIPAYLTLPPGSNGRNLPAIVMPHGGPGARDEWGFDWLSQYFANRGYAVIQPNYRGSTGYGDAWFQKNGFQSWRTAIGDVNDAGRYLLSSGIAAPGKLAIVGWSYGGYAALQSSVLDANLFKAIVAVAPVTDLPSLREERRNFTDFEMVSAFIGSGPQLREGSPAQNAERIKAPVLLFHGDQDTNVGISESRLMASRIRGAGGRVELVEFKGLDHQLDDPQARATLLSRSDAFLRHAMGL